MFVHLLREKIDHAELAPGHLVKFKSQNFMFVIATFSKRRCIYLIRSRLVGFPFYALVWKAWNMLCWVILMFDVCVRVSCTVHQRIHIAEILFGAYRRWEMKIWRTCQGWHSVDFEPKSGGKFRWVIRSFSVSCLLRFVKRYAEIIQEHTRLGGGLKYFLFSSLFGEMIQFD